MTDNQEEVILAQEQGALMRKSGLKEKVEAEFGAGEVEGTLVLTSSELIFVCTNERQEDVPEPVFPNPLAKFRFLYSEVEDLDGIPKTPPNLFIPLASVDSARGHRGELGRPSLEITWNDDQGKHSSVFSEVLTGRRRWNLNDWAGIIENLKAGRQNLKQLPAPPPRETLEGKVMHVLADMQEKGLFEIKGAVEGEYEIQLDPDEVQATCDRLSAQKLLVRFPDPNGDVFWRRVSPLGELDPSS